MLTPSQQFHEAKKALEVLNAQHATVLRQEHNRHEAEMKKRFEGVTELIAQEVERQLRTHLDVIHESIQRIEQNLKQHFGT